MAGYGKKQPKTIFGKRVSSVVPLVLNIAALVFYCTAVGATIYEDNTAKYSLWRITNSSEANLTADSFLSEALLPCPQFWVTINAGKIYSIAAAVFATLTVMLNLFDLFNLPFVSKAHGIMEVTTMFVGIIAWIITVSLMHNGVCDGVLAPRLNPGMKYGVSQAVEILATILSLIAVVFTYAF